MKHIWALLLFCSLHLMDKTTTPFTPLAAYQWPAAPQKVVRGFLTERAQPNGEKPLPNLGLWLDLDRGDVVEPYHEGEILYFETSDDMEMIGPIPHNMGQSVVVQHGKLLIRYSGKQITAEPQDSYEVSTQDHLFTVPENTETSTESQLYLEIFDTEFQTIINPNLLLPSIDRNVRNSQPFLELITLEIKESEANEANEETTINRSLRRNDQLPRGIYNLSFRFPVSQGPPLQLYVNVDGKTIYSELFDQVSGINSRLIINDRDLQDIYITGEEKFLLGVLNLQDKANSSVQLSVDEENIDGRHSINNYFLRIR